MRKIILALTCLLTVGLCACENVKKPGGNEMATGSRTFHYAYVHSQLTGDKYYHIDGWREYGPEGGTEYGGVAPYVGLELQLAVSRDVVYYYEPNLSYVLSKNYNPDFGKVIE